MKIPQLCRSIALTLALVVSIHTVSAQIEMTNRKPSAGTTYELNKRVRARVRVKPSESATDGTTIASVTFHFTNPNGVTFDINGTKGKNSVYFARKKVMVPGTWQWSVTATSSAGDEKTLPDRSVTVLDSNAPTTTPAPITMPTAAPAALSIEQAINSASEEIRTLLDSNQDLGAKFVRLGFHMCVGGCDGCIDINNPDNKGLEIPIDAIAPTVTKYNGLLSRADIWSLATLVAAEEAQRRQGRISFPLEYVGRTDCASNDGKTGPIQDLPSPDLTTHQLLTFFSSNFGLSTRETVALMGAHTIGQMTRENSGFNGQWANNNRILDGGYFNGLVGGDTSGPLSSDLNVLFDAPNWNQVLVDNSADPEIPNRHVWEHNNNRGVTLMTNSDIALVRDLSNNIDGSRSTCTFKRGRSPCPAAAETLRIAAEFKWDINLWVEEFRDVLVKMLGNGYTSETCNSPPCQI